MHNEVPHSNSPCKDLQTPTSRSSSPLCPSLLSLKSGFPKGKGHFWTFLIRGSMRRRATEDDSSRRTLDPIAPSLQGCPEKAAPASVSANHQARNRPDLLDVNLVGSQGPCPVHQEVRKGEIPSRERLRQRVVAQSPRVIGLQLESLPEQTAKEGEKGTQCHVIYTASLSACPACCPSCMIRCSRLQ